jgi:hypothetical protein
VGRYLSSTQEADSPAWADLQGAAPGGGLSVVGRWTPVSAFGVEVSGSVLGPVDPIAGGGIQPSGALVLVGGAGTWVGDVQPHGGVRVGGSLDRLRAWPQDGGDPPAPQPVSVGSAVFGVEGGVRAEGFRAALAGDFLLAAFANPYQARVRADGGGLVVGPLALEGVLELRTGAGALARKGPVLLTRKGPVRSGVSGVDGPRPTVGGGGPTGMTVGVRHRPVGGIHGADAEGWNAETRLDCESSRVRGHPRRVSVGTGERQMGAKGQAAEGVRREGPSMRMVVQRCRRRSSRAATIGFWPRNAYHSS